MWKADPTASIPPEYTALIFDCDGTLVDTMPAHYVAWCRALEPHGIALGHEQFLALAGKSTVATVELLAREQNVTCDAATIARAKDDLYRNGEHNAPAIEIVAAIARRERGRRKLAVASGNTTDIVHATLRGAGIHELFEVVIGADQVTRGKPAPDTFLLAAERLGAKPASCVVYEDADLGLQAARAAGMVAIDIRSFR
jgi:HAD superfamily hydrolase (TIGR01509 family)